MNLVIAQQNFRNFNPNLTWTPRLRAIWIYRNLHTLLSFAIQLVHAFNPYASLIRLDYSFMCMAWYFLTQRLHFILTHVALKSYGVVASNLEKSCGYATLCSAVNRIIAPKKLSEMRSDLNGSSYVLYLKPKSLVGIFIAKKLYKLQLVRFVQLLISNWLPLNTSYLYFSGYPIATRNWFVVRFVGSYYFRLLNF